MARPVRSRKILKPPQMAGFKPFGMSLSSLETVMFQYDEYESINLVNYQEMPQDLAAEKMGISRPTFTRIYNSALKKIAIAFVECKAIEIEGGNIKFNKQWYKCRKCHKLIEGLENHTHCKGCDAFSVNELINLNPDNE